MKNYFLAIVLLFLLLVSYFLFLNSASAAAAEIPQNLKNALNEKTQVLQEINQKILQTQKDLDEAAGKKKTLQSEIKQVDYQLRQLNLGIRSSEITIEKLNLEIQALGYDIEEVRSEINLKKAGIAQILREVQRKDGDNTLTTFLRNKSLGEALSEFQNLLDLNTGLSAEVDQLGELDNQLSDKLGNTSEKKNKISAENQNLKNRKLIASTQKSDRENLLGRTKNQERLYQNLITDLEKQQTAIAAEIEKLEAELRAKIDPNLLPISRPGVLAIPVPSGILSQDYGATTFARYGYKGKWHNGVDFAAPIGTPVLAAEKGAVLEVWDQDKYCYRGAYGKFIVIGHDNNLTTLYAHLSLQNVKKGDLVDRGQLIGYIGKTGYATGPHLHFIVYASSTFRIGPSKLNCGPIMPYGGDLDPRQYL